MWEIRQICVKKVNLVKRKMGNQETTYQYNRRLTWFQKCKKKGRWDKRVKEDVKFLIEMMKVKERNASLFGKYEKEMGNYFVMGNI